MDLVVAAVVIITVGESFWQTINILSSWVSLCNLFNLI